MEFASLFNTRTKIPAILTTTQGDCSALIRIVQLVHYNLLSAEKRKLKQIKQFTQ